MLEYDYEFENLGINKEEYKEVIKKFPILKDLKKKLDEYNDFLDAEYNSYDYESEEIFKKIFDLIKKIK